MDMGNFEAGMKAYSRGLGSAESATTKSGSAMSKALQGVGGIAKTALGVLTGNVLTSALKSVVSGVAELAQSALEIPNVAASFEGLGGSIEKMREGSLGMVTDVELMKSFNSAAQLVSQDFAQKLPDAMGYLSKVAAATGQDMGFMLDSLVKGVGRVSPMILDNLGIQVNLTEANEAYAASIGKDVAELTKQEQQTAIMNLTMQKLAENTAAMPEVAGTAAQSMASFQTTLENLKNDIGVAFIPVLQALLEPLGQLARDYGPAVVAWAQDAARWISDSLIPAIKTVMDVFSEFMRGFEAGGSIFEKVAWGIGEALDNLLPEEVMDRIWDFLDALAELGSKGPAVASSLGSAFETVRGVFEKVSATFMEVAEQVIPVVTKALEQLKVIFQKVATEAAPVLTKAFEDIRSRIKDVLDFVLPLVQQWAEFLVAQFAKVVDWVQANMPLIQKVIEVVFERIGQALDLLQRVWETAWPYIQKVVVTVFETVKIVVSTALDAILGIIKAVMQAITGDWEGAWKTLGETVGKVGKGVLEAVKTLIGGIVGIVSGAGKDFISAGKSMIDGFLQGIKDAWGAVTGWLNEQVSKLPDFVKKPLGISSPSKVFIDIGRDLLSGLAIGMGDGMQAVTEQAYEFTRRLEKVFRNISGAIGAVGQVEPVGEEEFAFKLTIIEDYVRQLIEMLQRLQSTMDEKGMWYAKKFNQFMRRVVGLLADSLDTIIKLDEWVPTSTNLGWKIEMMVSSFADMTRGFYEASSVLTKGMAKHAAEMADAMGDVVALVVPGIEAIEALVEWQAVDDLGPKARQFAVALAVVVDTVAQISGLWLRDAVKDAARFAESVITVVSFIEPSIDALTALATYEAREDPAGAMQLLAYDLEQAIPYALELARKFADQGLEKAKAVLDNIEGVVGFIRPAIEALTALGEWVRAEDAPGKIAALVEDTEAVTAALVEAAQKVDAEGLDASQRILAAIQEIVGFIRPAIDALTALEQYRQTNRDWYEVGYALASDISQLVLGMESAAAEVQDDLVPASTSFWDGIQRTLAIVQPALSALSAMAEAPEMPAPEAAFTFGKRLAEVVLNIAKGIEAARDIVKVELEPAAAAFWQGILGVVQILEPALAAVIAIVETPPMPKGSVIERKAKQLAEAVLHIARGLQDAIGIVKIDLEPGAVEFWNAIKGIVEIIGPAMAAIEAIVSTPPMPKGSVIETKAKYLAEAVLHIARGLQDAIGIVEIDISPAAVEFWNAIKGIIDIIKPAIDALVALADYPTEANLSDEIGAFYRDIATLLPVFEMLAADFSETITDDVAAFAQAVTTAINLIKPAIDALVALSDYTGEVGLATKAERLRLDLTTVIEELLILASEYRTSLPAIQDLASLMGSVSSSVKGGIDTLVTLLAYKSGELKPALDKMLDELRQIYNGLITARGVVQDMVPVAQDVANAARQIKDAIQSAFDQFAAVGQMGSGTNIWDSLINMLKNPPSSLYNQAWELGYGMALNIKNGLEYGLEIQSPSKVLQRIGEQMRAGLEIGWSRNVPQAQYSTVSTSNAYAVTVNMGGQTISSDMDMATLTATIKRVIVDAIRTAT